MKISQNPPYNPITQMPSCCTPASLTMILDRRKIPHGTQEEIGNELGLIVSSKNAHLFKNAIVDDSYVGRFGTRINEEKYSLGKFFHNNNINLKETYFSPEVTNPQQFVEENLQAGNDLLVFISNEVLYGKGGGHASLIQAIDGQEVTLIDPGIDKPKMRIVELNKLIEAMKANHRGGGFWVISPRKEIAIQKAQTFLKQIDDASHTDKHIQSVLTNAKNIAAKVPKVNFDIIEIAIWWHDTGYILGEEDHETRSAEMAKDELQKIGFDKSFAQKVYDAIVNHAMRNNPETIEGQILKDADKLDYLPIWRWQEAIKNQNLRGIQATIRNLPKIRNHRLHFQVSKELFDHLYSEFINFIKNDNSDFLKNYKKDLLDLKIEK